MFLAIIDILRARFEARDFGEVSIDAGKDALRAQTNYGEGGANRVVFVPISPMSVAEPMRIGEGFGDPDEDYADARQLWNVTFPLDVHIAAFDADRVALPLAHEHRCFDLWEVVAQEVQRAYAGVHTWTSARWGDARTHGRFGAELIATLALNIPLFDQSARKAIPTAKAGQPKPVP